MEQLLLWIFSLSDSCMTGVADAIKELKSLGIRTAMLTEVKLFLRVLLYP